MDRLCWAGLSFFGRRPLFMLRSRSPFGRRCDEPRGRRPIGMAQEPYVRPRVTRPRGTWTNRPLNPDLRPQLIYLV